MHVHGSKSRGKVGCSQLGEYEARVNSPRGQPGGCKGGGQKDGIAQDHLGKSKGQAILLWEAKFQGG